MFEVGTYLFSVNKVQEKEKSVNVTSSVCLTNKPDQQGDELQRASENCQWKLYKNISDLIVET